jgi:HK97 family phage prohead protease
MTTILYRTLPARLHIRADSDGRVIEGTVVPYGESARIGHYTERFAAGAFAGTDPAKIPLVVQHEHQRLPIGRALELTEEPTRLAGAFRISQTNAGNDVLALIADEVDLGLSIGFLPMPDGDRWSADRSTVERVRAELVEVSVVGFPAYDSARITAVRGQVDVPRAPRLALARLRRAA